MRATRRTTLPHETPALLRAALEAASKTWSDLLGARLISMVLFGSVARGDAHESSDIELLLKGALRVVAVEPARTCDVAELLRREAARFPDWMLNEIDHLAAISTEMAGDRGLAFYGDERQALGPQELFDESDASRAVSNLEYVAGFVTRLLTEHVSTRPPSAPSSDNKAD